MLGHQSDQEQTLIMSKVSTIPIHVNLEAQLQVLLIQRFSMFLVATPNVNPPNKGKIAEKFIIL